MYIAIDMSMCRKIAIVKAEAKRVRTPPTCGERGQNPLVVKGVRLRPRKHQWCQLLTGVHGTQNHNIER